MTRQHKPRAAGSAERAHLCEVVARMRVLVQLLRQHRQPRVGRNRRWRRLRHLQRRQRPVRRQCAALRFVARKSTDARARGSRSSRPRRHRRLRRARARRRTDLPAPREPIDPAWRAPCGAPHPRGQRAARPPRRPRGLRAWRHCGCLPDDRLRHPPLRLILRIQPSCWQAPMQRRLRRCRPTTLAPIGCASWARRGDDEHQQQRRCDVPGTVPAYPATVVGINQFRNY